MTDYITTSMLYIPKEIIHSPENAQDKQLRILAIDGGGTKTSATIVDTETGECITEFGGGSNARSLGIETAKSGIAEAVNNALAKTQNPSNNSFDLTLAIIASNDTPDFHQKFNTILGSITNSEKIISCTDTIGAWAAATKCLPGISFITGTGSQCLAVDDNGKVWSAGGCDWYVGDEGSGFQIGKLGISSVLKFNDSRGEKTLLTDLIYNHFQANSSPEILHKIHFTDNPKATIASAAECVSEAAQLGDEIAQGIFNIAAKEIAEHAKAILKECTFRGDEIIFGFTGSTTKAGDVFMDPIKNELKKVDKRLNPQRAQLSAAMGTALLGLKYFWGQEKASKYIESIPETE
jgi:glucosamine kinase